MNPDAVDAPRRPVEPIRPLALWKFAVVVLVYLAIIQVGGILLAHVGHHDDDLTTVEGVLWSMWIPLGVALIFTYGVVAALGWWRPVLRDDRPVRRWVWFVPVVFLACSLLAIDYGALSEKSVAFVLALFVATQLVGWGEEGMFRGIGVTALRAHGLTEGKVALWSSLVFGAVHLTNALGHGAQAIPQALAVTFAGYFFYLTRRVSGGNAVNSVLHGLFDFSLLTGTAILVDQEGYLGSLAAILAYFIAGVSVLAGRRRIEPRRLRSAT